MIKNQSFIGNTWISGRSSDSLKVYHKYNQSLLAEISYLTGKQTEETIHAAETGFKELKTWTPEKRAHHLQQLHDLLLEQKSKFIELIIQEAGKPRSYAEAELNRCLTTIAIGCKIAAQDFKEEVDVDYDAGKGKKAFVKRFPIGIVLCITPFNFPLNLLLHKVVPALACGCSVIVKPPPQAPLTSLAFSDLIKTANYPAGVYNVAICAVPEAEQLVKDDRIAKLSFTGSDKVGWHLKSICNKKSVSLELGGNAAVIIDEKTELNTIAKQLVIGSYLYAGQICISTQRMYAVGTTYDKLIPLLLKEIENLKSGDPNLQEVLVGPIIDRNHLKRIHTWVKEAVENGATLLAGGHILDEIHNLYAPTLFTNTKNELKIMAEEAFAPIASIEQTQSFEEAVKEANASKYGLQTGVYTNNTENLEYAYNNLEVGGVIANGVPGFRVDGMPYGGIKNSGLGREGIEYAIQEMTELRLLVY
jgi:glyceraldehyde-3-phosphate dehydrogenase (NADP+)